MNIADVHLKYYCVRFRKDFLLDSRGGLVTMQGVGVGMCALRFKVALGKFTLARRGMQAHAPYIQTGKNDCVANRGSLSARGKRRTATVSRALICLGGGYDCGAFRPIADIQPH
jgi:hypothetical protein